METFNTFEPQALAEKRIDFDGVDGYQCVDLILQYAKVCYGISGERGDAIDYWTNTSAVLLTKFDKIATQAVVRGDIVVLNGLAGNPAGHIMIATGNESATEFEGLEQNGQTGAGTGTGGDTIRTRYVQKVRIAGVLRPKNLVAPSTPAVALPAAPAAVPKAPAGPGETYQLAVPVKGYEDSNDAANHLNPRTEVPKGNYHVYNEASGMLNLTLNPSEPGNWINPGDNKNPALPPAPAPVAPPAPPAPQKPANIVFTKILPEPLSVVTNKQPTNKWHLDFPNDTEAVSAAELAEGTSFVAYGRAQRTDHDKPCYFMTQEDFGDADATGTPTNNVGVNTVDVDLQQITPPAPPTTPVTAVPPDETEGEQIQVTVKSWKDSLYVWKVPRDFKSNQTLIIHDLDDALSDTELLDGQPITLGANFAKDGVEYYLSRASLIANPQRWYGVPQDAVDEVTDNTFEQDVKNASAAIKKESAKATAKVATANGLVQRFLHLNRNKR